MKKMAVHIWSTIALGLLLTGSIVAQSTSKNGYVIYARAGVVNYTEGNVSVFYRDGKSGLLVKGIKLQAGDKVSTGTDGRVEVLLNPGSYLRLGSDSTFAFETNDLEDLKLNLFQGSAIFEVLAADDFKVSVRLPKAEVSLNRSGVFRIDVAPDGTGKISVWKGKSFIGSDRAELKEGRTALLGDSNVTISRFDRDNPDSFDTWSRSRAKELAKLNARLERRALRDSLIGSFDQGLWTLYTSFGLWVFDPVRLYWCFLPFGRGWGSPYGFGYYFDLWYCRLPNYIYMSPPPPPVVNPPVGNNPPQTTGNSSPNETNAERWRRLTTPTFQRVNPSGDEIEERRNRNSVSDPYDRDMRPSRGNWDTRTPRNTEPNPNYDTKPTYTPPPTPIIVMPNPAKAGKDN